MFAVEVYAAVRQFVFNDGNFLRSLAETVLQIIMEADMDGLVGAGRYERTGERSTYRSGYGRPRTGLRRRADHRNPTQGCLIDGRPNLHPKLHLVDGHDLSRKPGTVHTPNDRICKSPVVGPAAGV